MRYWILAGIVVMLISVISALPFGWIAGPALKNQGMMADNLQGRIWHGRILGLHGAMGEIRQADLKWQPAGLLRGVPFRISTQTDGVQAAGLVGPAAAKDAQLDLDLARLPLNDLRLAGLQGQLHASILELKWNREGCKSAKGKVRTDVLSRNEDILQWHGPLLLGPITCANGTIISQLAGKSPDFTIKADVELVPNGAYRAKVMVQTQVPRLQKLLPAYGFVRNGNNFALHEEGKLVR